MDQNKIQKILLDELGLSEISQDKKEQLLIKMTEVLLKRIFLETMEKLDEQAREEYQKLVGGGNSTPEQMEEFLKSRIGDYEGLVQKVVDEFKEEMKNDMN